MEAFTVAVLLTKEEYIEDAVQRARRVGPLAGAGAALALCGAVLTVGQLTAAVTGWSVALLGVLLVLCDTVFAPMLARVNAAAQYEDQPALRQAVTVTFSDDGLTLKSPRVEGTLPYAAAAATETPALLVLTFGAELTLRLPRRLFTDTQLTALCERLS